MDDYPQHGRGGQGVITFKTHPKSGDLVTARMVDPEHELILISEGGIILRTPVKHISLQGRPTQGVKLMDVGDDDRVAAVAVIDMRKEYARRSRCRPAPSDDGRRTATKQARRPRRNEADGKASGNGSADGKKGK